MKVKEITVSTARKLGLPGYSSLDVAAAVTVTLEDGDEPTEAYKRAWDTVEGQVVGRIQLKGLESPVAAEAQDKSNPQDWLDHESPEEQKAKINAAKRLKEVEKLRVTAVDSSAVIPSVMPTRKGGD